MKVGFVVDIVNMLSAEDKAKVLSILNNNYRKTQRNKNAHYDDIIEAFLKDTIFKRK